MFAVSQCARYTYCSKLSHEKVLKRIGRYLKGTRTKGLIMKPNKDLNIDCHVDSNLLIAGDMKTTKIPHVFAVGHGTLYL